MTDDKKTTSCCGGTCTCSGDFTCSTKDTSTKDTGECCSSAEGCGCAGGANPLDLSVEQIKKINEILGDIDDEDLETGNYDLDEKQAQELNNILFGK